MELNRHLDVALKDINEIRGRAGIKLLTAGNLTLDKVRHERKVELALKKHRLLGFETLAPGSSRCKQRWFDQFPRHGSLSVLQC